MQWTDEGIVLGVKRHGETSVILELMTLEHGRHLGLVRGGAGTRLRGVLQPGNSLRATWRARLDEHLGHYTVEGINLRAAGFLSAAHAVHGVTHLRRCAGCWPSASRTRRSMASWTEILDQLDDPLAVAPLIARFELGFLAELGFGLDLESCAATGTTADLVYVSPRSGRAVSRAAGEAYRDKLLALPAFLHDEAEPASATDLADAFALTGFFLDRHAFAPRGLALPEARAHFVAAITRVAARIAVGTVTSGSAHSRNAGSRRGRASRHSDSWSGRPECSCSRCQAKAVAVIAVVIILHRRRQRRWAG